MDLGEPIADGSKPCAARVGATEVFPVYLSVSAEIAQTGKKIRECWCSGYEPKRGF
ncbi:hypothetical protein JQK88_10445 [Mesorhizobium caraganae]|uniref:hypothetical protein n=1 Tax=Mesorhizobium caraganae TaxID=483206 RepID=UPI00193AC4D7|nr:hypothetical protein [Mesorhizobium caraganae]MBM2711665.1 hypothetical protein [Mesorhizobium caraganae]